MVGKTEINMTSELKKDLLKEVRHMVNFPFAQICRHSVALNILSIMEKNGYVLPPELVKAVSESSAGDTKALEILEKELI